MKRQKLPNIVVIMALTLVTVFFWIGLDLYRTLTKKPEPSIAPKIIAPLTPTLDEETLGKLEGRIFRASGPSVTTKIKGLETPVASVTPEPIPTASATATPTLSPTPTASATPTASP